MLAVEISLALGSLFAASFTPGFFFLRRARWNPLEKLCGSIGLSLIFLYLVTWAFYCLTLPLRPYAAVTAAILTAAAGILAWRDIVRLFQNVRVRQAVLGFCFLLSWTLLLLATIRNYSGGTWFGDWLEHFQRTLFFLRHFPASTPIFNHYPLPARPPMENVLAALFLAQTSDRFEIFQVVFAFFNLLMFLPCCLMLPAPAGPRKIRIVPLVALFALNPVVMVATTYTWTKALAAFYIVLALWFYLAGWRKRSTVRMSAAFVALAGGVLVHYSAGPYVAFLALHYLLFIFRGRERKWRELAAIAAPALTLLATWFAWSVAHYGVHTTLASNSSVTSSQEYQGSNLVKVAANLMDSIVPVIARAPDALHKLQQPNSWGTLRDHAFVFYQTNLVFGMGLIGGPLVLWVLWSRRRTLQRFWTMLIPFCVVLGVAVVGERDSFGVAHLTLLALQVLGLTLLAGEFRWRRAAGIALMAGCTIDFALGVFLHAHVESLENTTDRTVFENLMSQRSSGSAELLSDAALRNWYRKHQYALCAEWIRVLDSRPGGPDARQIAADVREQMQDDRVYFLGWYARHGGSTGFLGDHLAGLEFGGMYPQSWLLLLLFAVLGYGLRRSLPAAERAPAPQSERVTAQPSPQRVRPPPNRLRRRR